MRKIFLLAVLFIMNNQADAQSLNLNELPNNLSITQKSVLDSQVVDLSSIKRLNADNYIVSLKQDRMPCVILMITQPQMPNAYNGKIIITQIPNAWQKKNQSIIKIKK